MQWLTDADRRAADWLGRLEHAQHEHVGEPSVVALPSDGLRFDHAHMQGNRLMRYRIEDVGVGHNRIDRLTACSRAGRTR
jgi:hypothetical protein